MMKVLPLSSEPSWESVNSKCPCPVCGAETGCRLHGKEAFVVCENVPSEWPITNGAWLHREAPDSANAFPRRESSGMYASYDVNRARKALVSHSRRIATRRNTGS
jgi:hypothetical protein